MAVGYMTFFYSASGKNPSPECINARNRRRSERSEKASRGATRRKSKGCCFRRRGRIIQTDTYILQFHDAGDSFVINIMEKKLCYLPKVSNGLGV